MESDAVIQQLDIKKEFLDKGYECFSKERQIENEREIHVDRERKGEKHVDR